MNYFEITKLALMVLAPVLSFSLALYLFLRYGHRVQSSEARKSKALGDVFFRYEAGSKVYTTVDRKKFIELEVTISNQSSEKLAILAIFVKFRPVINRDKPNLYQYANFDSLPEFETMSDFEQECSMLHMRNIAFAKGFFWQTSVNGVSVRRGFDIVSEEFCKKYPLIMAQIIIYGSSIRHIDKTHYPKYRIEKLRIPFCNYLAEKNPENYDFFKRMDKGGYSDKKFKLKEGERILANKDGSLDVENTQQFFPVLTSVINSTMERVIELNPETKS